MAEVSQEVCFERHVAVRERQDRTENDVKELWKSVGEIRNILQGQSAKIAYIVGGITFLVNGLALLFQYLTLKGHP